jgi:hypothetical protein
MENDAKVELEAAHTHTHKHTHTHTHTQSFNMEKGRQPCMPSASWGFKFLYYLFFISLTLQQGTGGGLL